MLFKCFFTSLNSILNNMLSSKNENVVTNYINNLLDVTVQRKICLSTLSIGF